jgi:hypothetical protein
MAVARVLLVFKEQIILLTLRTFTTGEFGVLELVIAQEKFTTTEWNMPVPLQLL